MAISKQFPQGCCFLRISHARRQCWWRLRQGRATWHVATATGDKGLHIAAPIGASKGAWKRWFDQRLQHLHFCKHRLQHLQLQGRSWKALLEVAIWVRGRRQWGWRFQLQWDLKTQVQREQFTVACKICVLKVKKKVVLRSGVVQWWSCLGWENGSEWREGKGRECEER